MDFNFAGLRDRRAAASDEITTPAVRRWTDKAGVRHREVVDMEIFGAGSHARGRGSGTGIVFDREPGEISTIVLHQTDGSFFVTSEGVPTTTRRMSRWRAAQAAILASSESDGTVRSRHAIDRIIAHFVILPDGQIFYTRDVQFILNDAGGARGIDIEFAGSYSSDLVPPLSPRLSIPAIRAGRTLIQHLKLAIPAIGFIHPHGQVQIAPLTKLRTCCGPDIWMNVGEWAASALRLLTDTTDHGYGNNGNQQRNPAYDQHVDAAAGTTVPLP